MRVAADLLPAITARALELVVRARCAPTLARWPDLIVVLTPDGDRVLHRVAFAAELRAEGLDAAAHEVSARRVGHRQLLVYMLRDDEDDAGVSMIVVDLNGSRSAP